MLRQPGDAVVLNRYRLRRGLPGTGDGFSLLELVVVIIIISILMVLAIQRLLSLQVDAERVVMESVVGALRSAIGIKVAEKIVRQNIGDLATLENGNPMNLLAETPSNYIGELTGADPLTLVPGSWYFDSDNHVLVYIVDNIGYFSGGMTDPSRARFRMRLVYTDKNNNGSYDSGVDSIEGLRLAPLESYRWIK